MTFGRPCPVSDLFACRPRAARSPGHPRPVAPQCRPTRTTAPRWKRASEPSLASLAPWTRSNASSQTWEVLGSVRRSDSPRRACATNRVRSLTERGGRYTHPSWFGLGSRPSGGREGHPLGSDRDVIESAADCWIGVCERTCSCWCGGGVGCAIDRSTSAVGHLCAGRCPCPICASGRGSRQRRSSQSRLGPQSVRRLCGEWRPGHELPKRGGRTVCGG